MTRPQTKKRKPVAVKRRVLWRSRAERREWKQLAKRASRRARARGHQLRGWHITGDATMGARCERCQVAMALIALRPPDRYAGPMGGSALRTRCSHNGGDA